ncbi:MAG TPA: hypothetical protein VE052_00875 [Gemmatimonadaceae bacterium]|nr:hypothetical protein [Gemmatimonadaceae bacterium]
MAKKLEDDVRTAFERATEGTGSPEDLINAVRVLVRGLKKEGRPPENVVVTVKRLCGLSPIAVAADTDSNAVTSVSKRISDMVVRAAIDEYYAGTRKAPPPWKGYSVELEDLSS